MTERKTHMLESPKDAVLQADLEQVVGSEVDWEALRGTTVLVTGATGLVGSQLIRTLLCANRLRDTQIRILALIRSEDKAKAVFGELWERPELIGVTGDVGSFAVPDGPVDYIVHGASITNSKQMVTYPVDTILTTVEGTRHLLELAREKQSRHMVYLSSMEAYGTTDPALERVTEQDLGFVDPLKVRSCYPEGKRMAECLCGAYAHQYGVTVTVARLAQTFGAGVRYDESRVFAQFARSYIENTDIVLHTTGDSVGNYCYTADCVRGLLTLLTRGESGEAYNVVNPRTSIRIREMAQMIASLSEGRIKVVFDIPADALTYGYAPAVEMRLSGDKMRQLGFEAAVDLPEMYRRLIASMKAQKGLC